jgi:hypothetical protein
MRTSLTQVVLVAATAAVSALVTLCIVLPRTSSSQPYQPAAGSCYDAGANQKLDQVLTNQHLILNQLGRMSTQIERTWENTRGRR